MSTQNARDTHFFLAGWNGHIENANATTHFQQAMKSAPAPTEPLPAEHTTRSDAETMARAETTARFLLGWKYGQMPTTPDTLLRQSDHAKAQWAWNAACKLLRFIDGSAPAEVPAVSTEPIGLGVPVAQAAEPGSLADIILSCAPAPTLHFTTGDGQPPASAAVAAPDALIADARRLAYVADQVRALEPAGSESDVYLTEAAGVLRACADRIAALAATPPALTQAARDVLAERVRQISSEGWTPEHDDQYRPGEMLMAADSYISWNCGEYEPGTAPINWPWKLEWFKPTTERRNLEKAGALILAEIERIDRAAIAASAAQKGGEATVLPLEGDSTEEADLSDWQSGTSKPELDGRYLRDFDEGVAISWFTDGEWTRDGFFASDIQDAPWRGLRAASAEQGR